MKQEQEEEGDDNDDDNDNADNADDDNDIKCNIVSFIQKDRARTPILTGS